MKLIISMGILMFFLTFKSSDSSTVKSMKLQSKSLEFPIVVVDTSLKKEIKTLKKTVKNLELVVKEYKKDSAKTELKKKSWFAKTIAKFKL